MVAIMTLSSANMVVTVILCSLVAANKTAQVVDFKVTQDDLNFIFSLLHPVWPELSTPPASNISGLSEDLCNGSADCVAPRLCSNCESPPCFCVKGPQHNGFRCESSLDCDEGEHCEWSPPLGVTSGLCASSKVFAGRLRPILHTPVASVPFVLNDGLTGDRCFSHSNCAGARSCLGDDRTGGHLGNVSTCESSRHPCICTPVRFARCSSSKDCPEEGEECVTAIFNMQGTYSFILLDSIRLARLTPLCLSRALLSHQTIIPISNSSLISNISFLPVANILAYATEESSYEQIPLSIRNAQAFSVPGLSNFNSFTTHELANDFIVGLLSIVILSQLRNIFSGLIYSFPGIHQRGYSSYIIFSRLLSLRHIPRLMTLREPFPPSEQFSQTGTQFGIHFRLAILPLMALSVLYAAEFGTIIAGSQKRLEFSATRNFDPVIALVNGTRRPRRQLEFRSHCDDFFVPSRGLAESGSVLKCVRPMTRYGSNLLNNMIIVEVFYGAGRTTFKMYSVNGSYAEVELSTSLRSLSGIEMKTMPFRPELMDDRTRNQFLNGVLNNIRFNLGYKALDNNLILWSTRRWINSANQLVDMTFSHRHDWNVSLALISTAVTQELRQLDLVLNSSGKPWVYTRPYTFEPFDGAMARMKRYLISQGLLVIFAVVVSAAHVAMNTFVTHFDDVAYVAMRELIGHDCLLGPLADERTETIETDLRDQEGPPSLLQH